MHSRSHGSVRKCHSLRYMASNPQCNQKPSRSSISVTSRGFEVSSSRSSIHCVHSLLSFLFVHLLTYLTLHLLSFYSILQFFLVSYYFYISLFVKMAEKWGVAGTWVAALLQNAVEYLAGRSLAKYFPLPTPYLQTLSSFSASNDLKGREGLLRHKERGIYLLDH